MDPALGDSSTRSSSDDSPTITVRDDAVLPAVGKSKITFLMKGRVERQPGRLIRLPPEDDQYAAVGRPFIEHLMGLRDGVLNRTDLIDACLSGANREHLLGLVDEWLRVNLVRRRSGRSGRGRHRTALYNNSQDLWQKKRSILLSIILDGGTVEVLGEGDMPTVGDVKELYGGIFESATIRDEEPVQSAKNSLCLCQSLPRKLWPLKRTGVCQPQVLTELGWPLCGPSRTWSWLFFSWLSCRRGSDSHPGGLQGPS